MSKSRYVDTRFWSDGWVRKLNALDRYVFLYLLTNEHSSWCGVYELDIGMMAFECGVDVHDLEKAILPRLLPKIVYVDGWVYIKNFEKYHKNNSEQTKKGIEKAWESVPDNIRLKIKKLEKTDRPPTGGMQGVSPFTFTSTSTLTSTSISEQGSRARKSRIKKEKPIEEEKIEEPFVLIREIEKLEENERRELNIIALYFRQRKTHLENKAQLQTAIGRHLRTAKLLVPFTNDQLVKACTRAKSEYPDIWTLETLVKLLTK